MILRYLLKITTIGYAWSTIHMSWVSTIQLLVSFFLRRSVEQWGICSSLNSCVGNINWNSICMATVRNVWYITGLFQSLLFLDEHSSKSPISIMWTYCLWPWLNLILPYIITRFSVMVFHFIVSFVLFFFCAHNVVANLVLCHFFEYSAYLNKCEFTESDKFAIFFFDNG